jgi:restriction system protein
MHRWQGSGAESGALGDVGAATGTPILIIILAVGAAVALIWRHCAQLRLRQKAKATVTAAIKKHSPSLVRMRAQLVRPDPYGKLKFEKWLKHIDYFMTEHIMPLLTTRERDVLAKNRFDIKTEIQRFVERELQENPAFQCFSDDMTPAEFETFCAEELRRAGWDARVTMQSRDQGVDVIAEKNAVRVVIQCKLYARPVGNKSVQEAAAAKAHEQADYGIVVTNNRYTQDAEQLASTNKILLLHYTDLRRLDDLLGRKPQASDNWYYYDGARQEGPLSLQQLKSTLATLSNGEDVLVWGRGFSDWELAKRVPELGV